MNFIIKRAYIIYCSTLQDKLRMMCVDQDRAVVENDEASDSAAE